MDATRVVLGLPAYNKAEHLAEALESLLAQTRDDFAVVVADDCSTDGTRGVVESYARRDSRISYHLNPERLGLVGNWNRAFELARELHPDAPYFAWVSDHDVWHPGWLAALVPELDERPEVVLAYPLTVRIDGDGSVLRESVPFETVGIESRRVRLREALYGMPAGNIVYGLVRADPVARAGGLGYVLGPDRVLLSLLAVEGEFRQVPLRLWYRRFVGMTSRSRQRAGFFMGRTPLYAYLPVWLMHTGAFAWSLTVRRVVPDVGRGAAIALSAYYAWLRATIASKRTIRKQSKRARRAIGARRR